MVNPRNYLNLESQADLIYIAVLHVRPELSDNRLERKYRGGV
jgi:hypothetical protein